MIKTAKNKRTFDILGAVFPRDIYCLCCGDAMEPSRIHGVCDVCAEKINWDENDPFRRDEDVYAFDELLTCCRYGFYPRRIIAGFKLGARPYAASSIGLLLAERLAKTGVSGVLIVPVPMFPAKKRKRGFNQSELLAREVAGALGEGYGGGLLVKTKETPSMRLSSGDARRMLLDDSIDLAPGAEEKLAGRHIVLVDDVVTTGTTADSCARLLKQGGAGKVSVLCFAVSPLHNRVDIREEDEI